LSIFNLGGCFCDCDNIEKYFDINGFNVVLKEITSVNPNGSTTIKPLDTNTTVNFDKFIIQLAPILKYYSDNSIENKSSNNKFNFASLFINSAYACSCSDPGYLGTKEIISEINIFSSYAFTSSGSITDTLSKYFDISGYKNQGGSIQQVDLVSFTKTNPMPLALFNFILKVKPSGSLKHKFTIQYKHTNGEIFTVTTPTIEFKP